MTVASGRGSGEARPERSCALRISWAAAYALADAVHTILAARPDLREAVASKLYERGSFSLGRAAEWAGISIEAMKEALHRHGVSRQAPEGPSEVEAMAREALKAARRPMP